MNRINERIIEACLQLGLTQADLTRQLGISRTSVSQWFTNKAEPSEKHVIMFMEKNQSIDCNYIVRGEGYPVKNKPNDPRDKELMLLREQVAQLKKLVDLLETTMQRS